MYHKEVIMVRYVLWRELAAGAALMLLLLVAICL